MLRSPPSARFAAPRLAPGRLRNPRHPCFPIELLRQMTAEGVPFRQADRFWLISRCMDSFPLWSGTQTRRCLLRGYQQGPGPPNLND